MHGDRRHTGHSSPGLTSTLVSLLLFLLTDLCYRASCRGLRASAARASVPNVLERTEFKDAAAPRLSLIALMQGLSCSPLIPRVKAFPRARSSKR